MPLYPRGKAPGTHYIEGWMGLKFGLEAVEKKKDLALSGIESGKSSS
jgi:hypothetical protein